MKGSDEGESGVESAETARTDRGGLGRFLRLRLRGANTEMARGARGFIGAAREARGLVGAVKGVSDLARLRRLWLLRFGPRRRTHGVLSRGGEKVRQGEKGRAGPPRFPPFPLPPFRLRTLPTLPFRPFSFPA